MNKIKDYFFRKLSKPKKVDHVLLNKLSLEDMANLDLHDKETTPFPYNKFDIRIWTNDHNPPHFHVIDTENKWNLSFLIENGETFKIKKIGKDYLMYNYIVRNVPKWLKMKCNDNKEITNQQNAINIWNKNHEQVGTSI